MARTRQTKVAQQDFYITAGHILSKDIKEKGKSFVCFFLSINFFLENGSKDVTIKVKVQTKFLQLLFVANASKVQTLNSQLTKNSRIFLLCFSEDIEEVTMKISI